ncbi:hypothetical protein A0256_19950 [Mucilaginibacter sp. PAMC 26640]|nr:hypothetical protein A0256_19950 [Mucilaginibacter sp. PAMC 26640]
MSELSDALRLKTAQFNNFLIENYLGKIKARKDVDELHTFLFGAFLNLSEHLSAIGSILASLNNVQKVNLAPINDAISEAITVVYLIEKSADFDDLTSNIHGINTASLLSSIHNINSYGEVFNESQANIDTEINELKQDNPVYFAADGTPNFPSYKILPNEALSYLTDHASVLQVKLAFKKIRDATHCFSTIDDNSVNYEANKLFVSSVLNTLTVILIALGYIEPFFLKASTVAGFFEQQVKEISALQTALIKEL